MYQFRDTAEQERLLRLHASNIDRVNAARSALKPPLPPILFNLERAIELLRKRVDEFYNGTSIYFPHQGEKEMAKRRARL